MSTSFAGAVLAGVAVALAPAAGAQGGDHHQHADHARHTAAASAPLADARQAVEFPPPLREHTLANMRDHLLAIAEIQAHLGAQRYDAAAAVAEQRLGMSSLHDHGAHEVAKYMPQGMKEAGTAMHRAASRFALAAQEAAVDRDVARAVGKLAEVAQACVGCHAGYRFK